MVEGWRRLTVEEICERVSVGIVVKPSQYYVDDDDGIKAFRSANISENKIVDKDWVYLSPEGHATNGKSALKAGDVLVVRSGAPGTACVVTPAYEGANCIDVVFARPNTKYVLPEYLAAFTNSSVGKKHVLGNQGGLALKHFNVSAYKRMEVTLPSLPEQHKIAEILRTWDEAIEKLEKLIDRVKRRHLAITHSLIFGSRRLLRFKKSDDFTAHHWFALPKEWDCQPIGKLAIEVSERNGNREAFEVLSCSKYEGFVRSLEYFKKQVFSSDLTGYKKIWRGDFGFPSNHVEEGSIGLQDLVDVGIVSPIYTVFRFAPEKINRTFAFSVLKTGLYRHIFEVSTSASVDRRGSLRWKEFAKIPFPVPPRSEQEAISEVLAVHSHKLTVLKEQRDMYVRQKRGLMQKLLTGEWRVRV